jgi:Fur family ferric uptake transcriptional regulator
MAKRLSTGEIKTAENIFQEYLRDRGLKYTPERQMVLHKVLESDQHFEAEELSMRLREDDQRVAKATIYRTLPLLVNCGILSRVQFGEKLTRYENAFSQGAHDHMICLRCRRIIEFDNEDVIRLRTVLAARHKFHAQSHRFQITGLCQECMKETPPEERPFIPETDKSQEYVDE